MYLSDLPTEIILEISAYLEDALKAFVCFASLCPRLYSILWPTYVAMRAPTLEEHGATLKQLLTRPTIIDVVPLETTSDDGEEDVDDAENGNEWRNNGTTSQLQNEWDAIDSFEPPAVVSDDPFQLHCSHVTVYLYTHLGYIQQALRSFILRVPHIDNITLEIGIQADIKELASILRASAFLPDASLTIQGEGFLTGHDDWQSGPFSPLPSISQSKVQNPKEYAYAMRRPRTVKFFSDFFPQTTRLSIGTDAMFIASLYPLTIRLLVLAPITSLTLQNLTLDAFNWSQILPEITMHHLEEFSMIEIADIAPEDLIPFLRRHRNIATLNLAYTEAKAMPPRLLNNFDLPRLHSVRADPSYLAQFLNQHISGRFKALQTVSVTFPARMSRILRYIPKDMPPELDDPSFHDLDDFHAVYGFIMRSNLTAIELENLRCNGFIEWIISASGKWAPPRSVQDVVIIDGDLRMRRGTLIPLSQWMNTHCATWTSGSITRATRPTDAVVEDMLRTFFTVVFPSLKALKYQVASE